MLNAILWENGGTWSVTRNTQSGTEGLFDMTMGVVLHDQISVHGHSDVIEGCVPT